MKRKDTVGPLTDLQTWTFEGMQDKEDSVAIFTEDDLTALVRVTQITADVDSIRCLVFAVPIPGFYLLPRRMCGGVRLFASWDVFSGDDLVWHARYVPWYVFFEEQLIQDILRLAETAARDGRLIAPEKRSIAAAEFWIRDHERRHAMSKGIKPNPSDDPSP